MEGLNTAVESLMTLAGTMLTTITANPVLCIFFASGLVGIVIGIVRKIKHV